MSSQVKVRNPSPSEAQAPAPAQLSHRQIQVVLLGVLTGMLLSALDQSIVGTALPVIVSDLGGLNHLAWVVTAYLLTSTATTPLWGKISDLYGRRLIFQTTIIIFLVGSMLCGLAQDMPQLIIFRAIQGIGGGGLMAIAFAIIGDVIPARERGRYQGYFAAMFGLSSVAGPLLGGYLTDTISWRWIFYINLPLGLLALIVTTMALKMPVVRQNHKVDYLGAAVIVGSVSALLLYLNYAVEEWGWFGNYSLGLLAISLVLLIAFVFVELRAEEPIIPMRLWRNQIFTAGNLFGFFLGAALFGSAIYLPLYFQAVRGYSPTLSGLALVPLVAGIFTTSVATGLLVTRTGRYRIFPVLGAPLMISGLLLLTRIQVDTPYWQIAIACYILGTGLGCGMAPVLTAIQNAVEMRDMGSATSVTTFTRSLGGAVGAALFGAVLVSRLGHYLHDHLGNQAGQLAGGEVNVGNMQLIRAMEEPLKSIVLESYTQSIADLFLIGVPLMILALIAALLIKEIPLRTSLGDGPPPMSE